MRLKFKTIRRTADRKVFLYRIALYLNKGSIKIHFIIRDDIDSPHTHPWNYKSCLISPYKEIVWVPTPDGNTLSAHYSHLPFTIVHRECEIKHQTTLYRILGVPIPALTIGRYSDKKQLCSFCAPYGYCRNTIPKDEPAWDI